MSTFLEPVQQLIKETMHRVETDDPALYNEIVRRVPMLHPGGHDQAREELQRILEYASEQKMPVEITYMPAAGERAQERRVTPEAIEGEHLKAYCHLHQEAMTFRLAKIMGARLLNGKGRAKEARAFTI